MGGIWIRGMIRFMVARTDVLANARVPVVYERDRQRERERERERVQHYLPELKKKRYLNIAVLQRSFTIAIGVVLVTTQIDVRGHVHQRHLHKHIE